MKTIFSILSFFILLFFIILGIFCAIGVCVVVWGGDILKTAISSPPDLNHPASITFLSLTVICMFVGAFEAIFGIIIPTHVYFKVPFNKNNSMIRTIKAYSDLLKEFIENIR